MSWKPDPFAVGTDALWKNPSILPHRQMPEEDSAGKIHDSSSGPCVGIPAVVPPPTQLPDRDSNVISTVHQPAEQPLQPATPTMLPSLGRVEGLQGRLSSGGISSEASDLITVG